MAKIFNAPSELALPGFDWEDTKTYHKECDQYLEDLKQLLIKKFNRSGKNVGEIISFPVADGEALYMVASMKPLELVHIAIGDAYHFQYANRLTAKDVQQKVDLQKALQKMFEKK